MPANTVVSIIILFAQISAFFSGHQKIAPSLVESLKHSEMFVCYGDSLTQQKIIDVSSYDLRCKNSYLAILYNDTDGVIGINHYFALSYLTPKEKQLYLDPSEMNYSGYKVAGLYVFPDLGGKQEYKQLLLGLLTRCTDVNYKLVVATPPINETYDPYSQYMTYHGNINESRCGYDWNEKLYKTTC